MRRWFNMLEFGFARPVALCCWLAFIGGSFIMFPKLTNTLMFRGVLLNWPYLVIFAFGLGVVVAEWRGLLLRTRRSVMLVVLTGVLSVAGWVGVESFSEYLTYQRFAQFHPRTQLVATDLDAVRYTALQTAFVDIENAITAATEDVVLEHVQPLVTSGWFRYIAPITPDGIVQRWIGDNPGFMVYEDAPGPGVKVHRASQAQAIGIDERFTDNLWWNVYRTDWFATYEDPHYITLDDARPDAFVVVVPKIKYAGFRLPYWAGIIIIHPSGVIEELDRAAALRDARLVGKWIAPMGLLRHYVEAQNYAVGYFAHFFQVAGKLAIPTLEGQNQFPLLTRGADRHDYFAVATSAEGGASGLYRMYYGDAYSFDLSVYEFAASAMVYGPMAALARVQNLPGYNWYRAVTYGPIESHQTLESGTVVAIEPVYIVRPAEPTHLYWKFSITNKEYAGMSAVAVVDAANPDDVRSFDTRPAFESWLRGGTAPTATEQPVPTVTVDGEVLPLSVSAAREELLQQILMLAQQIPQLRVDIQALKEHLEQHVRDGAAPAASMRTVVARKVRTNSHRNSHAP